MSDEELGCPKNYHQGIFAHLPKFQGNLQKHWLLVFACHVSAEKYHFQTCGLCGNGDTPHKSATDCYDTSDDCSKIVENGCHNNQDVCKKVRSRHKYNNYI